MQTAPGSMQIQNPSKTSPTWKDLSQSKWYEQNPSLRRTESKGSKFSKRFDISHVSLVKSKVKQDLRWTGNLNFVSDDLKHLLKNKYQGVHYSPYAPESIHPAVIGINKRKEPNEVAKK